MIRILMIILNLCGRMNRNNAILIDIPGTMW